MTISLWKRATLDLRWEQLTGESVHEIIFLSKHTAVSNRPALTIQPIGTLLFLLIPHLGFFFFLVSNKNILIGDLFTSRIKTNLKCIKYDLGIFNSLFKWITSYWNWITHLNKGDVPPQGGKPGWAALPKPRIGPWLRLLKNIAFSHNLVPEFEVSLSLLSHLCYCSALSMSVIVCEWVISFWNKLVLLKCRWLWRVLTMDHSLISLICSLRLVCLLSLSRFFLLLVEMFALLYNSVYFNSLLFLSCLFLSYFHVYVFLQSNRSVKIVFLGFAPNAKPSYGYKLRKLNKLRRQTSSS